MIGLLDGWLRPRRRERRRERGMRRAPPHAPPGRTDDAVAGADGSGSGGGGGNRSRKRRSGAVCDACGAPGASMCADRIGLAAVFLCHTCRGGAVE